MEIKGPIAKITPVTVHGDLRNYDVGRFKEFSISLDHHFFSGVKTLERVKGVIARAQILSPLSDTSIKVKVTELDEYRGASVDAIIGLPFALANPDDEFIEDTLYEGQTLTGEFKSDKVTVSAKEATLLNGEMLLNMMSENIAGCHLDKGIVSFDVSNEKNRHQCRNYIAANVALYEEGFSLNDIEDLMKEFAPDARADRLEYMKANIQWWQRNFGDK